MKEYYENLQHSGTASAEQIKNARDAYENAQKFVISHANDGVLGRYATDSNGNRRFESDTNVAVSSIKQAAQRYASKYSSHSDVMRTAASANTYGEINSATIAAQNEAITRKDAVYEQAVANRDAVKNTQGK